MSRSKPGLIPVRAAPIRRAVSGNTIRTWTSEQFEEVCAREKRGEIVIHSLICGKENGHYTFVVTFNRASKSKS